MPSYSLHDAKFNPVSQSSRRILYLSFLSAIVPRNHSALRESPSHSTHVNH